MLGLRGHSNIELTWAPDKAAAYCNCSVAEIRGAAPEWRLLSPDI